MFSRINITSPDEISYLLNLTSVLQWVLQSSVLQNYLILVVR